MSHVGEQQRRAVEAAGGLSISSSGCTELGEGVATCISLPGHPKPFS